MNYKNFKFEYRGEYWVVVEKFGQNYVIMNSMGKKEPASAGFLQARMLEEISRVWMQVNESVSDEVYNNIHGVFYGI